MVFRIVTKFFPAMLLAVLAACAPTVMKAYPGPVLPLSHIARIENGAYASIEVFDGRRVTGDAVEALPGTHTIVVRPMEYRQPAGPY